MENRQFDRPIACGPDVSSSPCCPLIIGTSQEILRTMLLPSLAPPRSLRAARGLLATGVLLLLLMLAGCRPGSVWSPDGKWISLQLGPHVLLYSTATRQVRPLGSGRRHTVAPTWSPDSRSVAFLRTTHKKEQLESAALWVADPASGRERLLVPNLQLDLKPEPGVISLGGDWDGLFAANAALRWSPDGRQVFCFVGGKGGRYVWTANVTGSPARKQGPLATSVELPSFSPDGRRIACISEEKDFQVLEVATATLRTVWVVPEGKQPGIARAPMWSPDGKSLVVLVEARPTETSPDGKPNQTNIKLAETCELWKVPLTEGAPEKLADIPGPSIFVSLTPDLRRAAFATGKDGEEFKFSLMDLPAGPTRVLYRFLPPTQKQEGAPDLDLTIITPSLSPDTRTVSLILPPGVEGSRQTRLVLIPAGGGAPSFVPLSVPAAEKAETPARPVPGARRRR